VVLGRDRVRVPGLVIANVLVCGSLLISAVNARDMGAWAEENYRWGAAVAVCAAAIAVLRRSRDHAAVLFALAAGIVFCFVYGLYQAMAGSGPPTFVERGVTRAHALFGEPNPLAAFATVATMPLLAVGVAAFGRELPPAQRRFRLAMLGSGVLGAATVVLTQSEGGAAGFVCGVVTLAWRVGGGGLRRAMVTLSVALALVMLGGIAASKPPIDVGRIIPDRGVQVTSANFAERERFAHWGAAAYMLADSPWLGVGAGNFDERFREFTSEWRFRIPRGHAHNAYLQAAGQAGTVGLICYVGLIVTAFVTFVRRCTPARGLESNLRSGALAATVAIAVHGLVDYLHVLSIGIALAGVWALGLAVTHESAGNVDS
jgi:O-antigen ligase